MIICICKNLNEKRIREAITSNADSPAAVFAACGAPLDPENPRKDRCLLCVRDIREEIHKKVISIALA